MTIAALAMFTVVVCGTMAIGQSAGAPGPEKPSAEAPKRDRYLLLDSRIIESAQNAKLTVGAVRKDENNPLFKEDKPWEPRFDNPYCSVIYDEAEKKLPGLDDGDTYNCTFWDPALGKYVLFTRDWGGTGSKSDRYGGGKYRRESRSESPDFLNWSPAKVVIEGLDKDLQIHDMPVFRHAGVYIGLVGLFDIVANRQHVELAWSPDSIEWHRIQPGTPLIANSEQMGDYDWGCIFASPPILRKDEILLYYGGNNGRFMGWRSGFFCLARLRPDGFAGYEQIAGGSNKTAAITTRPVTVVAGSLCISADTAPSGYVKVMALDKDNSALAEGELIAKTVTDAEVQWKKGFSLKELKGKEIKLRFELRESKIYSFSFHR